MDNEIKITSTHGLTSNLSFNYSFVIHCFMLIAQFIQETTNKFHLLSHTLILFVPNWTLVVHWCPPSDAILSRAFCLLTLELSLLQLGHSCAPSALLGSRFVPLYGPLGYVSVWSLQCIANPTPISLSYLLLYWLLACLSPKLLIRYSSRPPNQQVVYVILPPQPPFFTGACKERWGWIPMSFIPEQQGVLANHDSNKIVTKQKV